MSQASSLAGPYGLDALAFSRARQLLLSFSILLSGKCMLVSLSNDSPLLSVAFCRQSLLLVGVCGWSRLCDPSYVFCRLRGAATRTGLLVLSLYVRERCLSVCLARPSGLERFVPLRGCYLHAVAVRRTSSLSFDRWILMCTSVHGRLATVG